MSIARWLILPLLAVAALGGCSRETGTPGETPQGAPTAVARPDAPVVIAPASPTVLDVISLRANMDMSGAAVRWLVNDQTREDLQGEHLQADALSKGDRVQAVIVKNNREFPSNVVTIQNTPPTLQRARMEPEFPRAGGTLRVNVTAEDPDGDDLYFRYQWYVNGQLLGDRDELEEDLRRGDAVVVEITVNDGSVDGATIRLKAQIHNTPPVVTEGAASYNGSVYTYAVTASDPDGDSLTYALVKGPDGATVDPNTGLITWNVGPDTAGKFPLQLAVADGHGGKTTFGIDVILGAEPAR